MDAPGHSPAVFPLWKIMEQARGRGIPVLLEGQGGDEILAGYNHHFALALVDSLEALVRRPSTSQVRDLDTKVRGGARAFGARRLAAEAVAETAPSSKEHRTGASQAHSRSCAQTSYAVHPGLPPTRRTTMQAPERAGSSAGWYETSREGRCRDSSTTETQ